MKYLLRMKKYSKFSFTSHNDMSHIVQAIIKRAEIPMEFSQGFHPMPLISYSPAKPLGYIDRAFFLTISTKEPLNREDLIKNLPSGLDLIEVREVADNYKITKEVAGYEFKVYLSENLYKIFQETEVVKKGEKIIPFNDIFENIEVKMNKNGIFMIKYTQKVENLYNFYKIFNDKLPEKFFYVPICEKALWRV